MDEKTHPRPKSVMVRPASHHDLQLLAMAVERETWKHVSDAYWVDVRAGKKSVAAQAMRAAFSTMAMESGRYSGPEVGAVMNTGHATVRGCVARYRAGSCRPEVLELAGKLLVALAPAKGEE